MTSECNKFYKDVYYCYNLLDNEKDACFRKEAGFTDSSEDKSKRLYIVALLYELEEYVEVQYEKGSIKKDRAVGLLTDIICCPGGDFCSLANAKSIPVATAIQNQFDDLDYLHDLGELDINISGCMNACGHHHVGNIGILGVDKKGQEFFQVSIGGSAYTDAALAKIIGPSFAEQLIPDVIQKIVDLYVEKREDGEQFIETYNRIGIQPFKDTVY